ncbi:hypothetical protein Tco_0859814 [Tanacetum coccineum]|uniref:Retrovirus-related Pol polyprotein from transposon TNT 1-94 n=1 Tax=Tanacetum coccineum TaxID=301880 RepID=A0ABQ5BG55_9ASTR
MLVVIWTEKVPQVPVKYLVENWFVGVLRNSNQWLFPQLRLNMLLLLGVVAIAISNNPVLHSRTKHIDIRYHLIRDHILKGDIELHFIPTEYQLADIFTKPLNEHTFTRLKAKLEEIIYSDLVTKLLNKSRLKYVSYPRFISCALQVLLGSDYTRDENFGFLPGILSNSNFTKDPSKVTDIELTTHMITINSQKDSVSPLPLAAKLKKGKSQNMTPTIPNTGLPSTLDEGTRKSQTLFESTATHPKDSRGNIQSLDRDLTSTTSGKGTAKTTLCLEGSLGDKDSGGNIPPANMEPIHPNVVDLPGLVLKAFLLSDDEAQESEEDILGADKPQSSHAPSTEASDTDSSCDDILKKYDNILPLTERQLVKDQIDKLVEASMSPLDKSSNTISDLYKGLNIITELLKEIKNAVKDDFVIKKISEATKSFTKFSTNIIDLQFFVNTLQAHALKQDEELSAWAKSSTNMAWNLGSRLSGLERAQNHIQSSMSSLKEDTHSIKTMMSEMYEVFKGQSSGSVTPTLSLTHILANVEGENATNTATEEPPSHTEGETNDQKLAI